MSLNIELPPPDISREKLSPSQEKNSLEIEKLRHAAKEFERVMVSRIFKEGMKAAEEMRSEDDESSTSGSWREIANEQLANHAGRHINLGIADAMVERLKDQL